MQINIREFLTQLPISLIGHITIDTIDNSERPGGSAYYTAQIGKLLNCKMNVFTTIAPNMKFWPALSDIPLSGVETDTITTFRLTYQDEKRQLTLKQTGPQISIETKNIYPSVLYCPVTNDEIAIETLQYIAQHTQYLFIAPQGLLRRVNNRGQIQPRSITEIPLLPHHNALFLSQEDHPLIDQVVANWLPQTNIVYVTQGKSGVVLYHQEEIVSLPTYPTIEIDPTGAGDCFAFITCCALSKGMSPQHAGLLANACASLVVEGNQLGNLNLEQAEKRFQYLLNLK